MKITQDKYGYHQQALVRKYGYLAGFNKYRWPKKIEAVYESVQLQSEIYLLLL